MPIVRAAGAAYPSGPAHRVHRPRRSPLPRLLLTALVAFSVTPPLAAQEPPPAPATDVRALENELLTAVHEKDRGRLEALLAPDYVLRSAPDVDRQTWIRNTMTLCWGDRSDVAGFVARDLGAGVIVASFELTFFVDPNSCNAAVLRSLVTDVWRQGPDGWRLQIRHSGPAPAPGAGVAAQFRAVPLPPPDWDIEGELSLVATGGNTSTRTLGLGATVLHRGARTTTRGAVSFVTSEAESVTQARSIIAQGRHGIRVSDRLEVFGQGLYTRDRFAGIENRAVADSGLAYTTPLSIPHSLVLEGGLGYTVEHRLDATELRFATPTATLRYRWRFRPGTDLTEDLALVGDVSRAPNWRGTSTTQLTMALNELLSVRASNVVEYRNRPVLGFGRTDTRTAVALVVSMERR